MPLANTKEDILLATALIGIGVGVTTLLSRSTLFKYKLPKVWKFEVQGGTWGKVNRPTAGPQQEKALPCGKHSLQLYSMATPNGVKVTALLEELNLQYGLEYDAWAIDITQAQQFTSGFVDANPNSKIPVLLHYENGLDSEPTRVFESAAIMMYLCEKFDKQNLFLPSVGDSMRAECLSWLMFTQGSAPFVGGGFGHFYRYAPIKIKYAVDRYSMEVKRLMDVLDRHLGGVSSGKAAGGPYLCGNQITIADLACWAWFGWLVLDKGYTDSVTFLQLGSYRHVNQWARRIAERKGVIRGSKVNRFWGEQKNQLVERHSSADFDALEKKD